MMQPYWDAQNAGGTLLQINSASFMGEGCNQTKAIAEQLQLEFELLPDLQGTACPDGVENQLTVERINNAAGVWFGGGLPGRTVSCMMGYSAEAFGVNSNPEDMASPVLRALWAHPLVGGISAGAMMQPSAALYNGNEISYTPGFHQSAEIMRVGELMMNNRGSVSDLLYFDSSFLHFCPNVLHFCSNLRHLYCSLYSNLRHLYCSLYSIFAPIYAISLNVSCTYQGFVADPFTIHSHFSERGYQGMLPIGTANFNINALFLY